MGWVGGLQEFSVSLSPLWFNWSLNWVGLGWDWSGGIVDYRVALNLSTLNAGVLIMVYQVILMMFLLKTVDYSFLLSICIIF